MKPLARHGAWQVDCESCRVPIPIELKQETAICMDEDSKCPYYGIPKPVEWMKDTDAIEKLLRKAPLDEQYYHPIWTAKEFKKVLNDPNHVVGP